MMRNKEQTLEARSNDISIEQKKAWAKQFIDVGYSVEWAHETNRMRVYIASDYHENGWTDEVSAHVILGEYSSGRLGLRVAIIINSNSPRWKPLSYHELDENTQARKLYEDVLRIFAKHGREKI